MNLNTLPDSHYYPDRKPAPEPARAAGMTTGRLVAIFIALLAAGVAIRLWRLGVSPAWQWDEAVYWRVSSDVQHRALTEHDTYGVPWQPFLYQPPMFFAIEARWFDLVGSSIYHARLFGVTCAAVTQVLLLGLIARLHGLRVALLTVLPVIFDGWLLYIERVSYIENALLILVVLGFLLYAWALDRPSLWRFFLAGVALGSAASFKQTGAYVVVAAVLCWVIVRRQHRGHLVMLGGALLVVAWYVTVMVLKYDAPGHPFYINQSLVQVRRVLGLQQSGGTLTSPVDALHLLTQQYKYFVPSLVVAACGIAIAVRRTWRCFLARSWVPVRPNAVLYAWLVTGLVVFGVSSLKFPQYFVLILLPAYCFFWTELAQWRIDQWWKRFWPIAAAVIGTMSFLLTVPVFNVNSLAEVQAYAADRIPASAIVVTEQSIGDLIDQRWCTVEKANPCLGHATYAITWATYLQSSFTEGDAAFFTLMKGATKVTSFSGAVGTATVWKLRISP
ncbi:MAG TPA: phospholipid carrier-dependent glycosyltransferase [Trebonia sp.]|nr:phospholipid carrier-dependent glycosyltransferase [Trebonia sp.]